MGIPYVYTGSAALFDQAKHALQTIEGKGVFEREHGQREAIIVIVFSALALEAFINEVGDLAASPELADPTIIPPSMQREQFCRRSRKGEVLSNSSIKSRSWFFRARHMTRTSSPTRTSGCLSVCVMRWDCWHHAQDRRARWSGRAYQTTGR